MELKDTIKLMESEDYKERFKAEYYQTKIRYEKLKKLNNKIEAYKKIENFDYSKITIYEKPKHECPDGMLSEQEYLMREYLHILEVRAEIEKIEL